VYRNNLGGYSIQYWFFYAYNDYISAANHEADWEHIRVQLGSDGQPAGVYYAAHHGGTTWQPLQVTWYNVTHPQVWVADGSHASYASEGECDATISEGTSESCWTNLDQRWFTWTGGKGADRGMQGGGLVNVGEMPITGTYRAPMPGQQWLRYSGRWGEEGQFDDTSGPKGPGYQTDSWNADFPSTGGTGGSSGECTSTGNTVSQLQPSC